MALRDRAPAIDSSVMRAAMSASTSVSLAYIRRYYGVPAELKGRVRYTGSGLARNGTIVGTSGAHLLIVLDGDRDWAPYHPTWELEYERDHAGLGIPCTPCAGPCRIDGPAEPLTSERG
ncbi:hypothetical protein ACWKSP_26335 [Micromonosporaceae bacterium Da 78-11]